ncbi:SRPBCC family protein [Metabacillus sediminilitoris]|uniref:SRPBCC domain-containing protein n=1 Tax=Metabacillus sediminilitoris TaxID=2567941 RepID=A0A4S4BMF9_9BACI|nr:SRPBCC domain-containing protein [Metabacillus sediminilitoris]QGQ44043.1 SRPBCC domain-containing protein [Metabacillus sediminilitoris]THF75443.1 SRPBCC domain-containing protein [Metabacillus sediminilitoris]
MSDNKPKNSLITKVEGRELIIERIIDAPRDLVFKAFSVSKNLESWWGPKGWQTENYKFEFEPNGVWHYCMRCNDRSQGDFYGQESWGKAVYHEIIVPEKIVYTDTFSDKEGNAVDGMPEILVTIMFVEYEGKTKLVTRSQFISIDTLQQVMDMGVVEGFASQLESLDDYLKELP